MSTKIYDGFRFVTNDFTQIQAALDELTAAYRAEHARQVEDIVYNVLVNEGPSDNYFDLYRRTEKRVEEAIGLTGHHHCIMVRWLPERDMWLGLPICNLLPFNKPIKPGSRKTKRVRWVDDVLMAHPLIEEYGYWDNVDPPSRMSKKRWEQRRKDWDFLDVPSQSMMIRDCTEAYVFMQAFDKARFHLRGTHKPEDQDEPRIPE